MRKSCIHEAPSNQSFNLCLGPGLPRVNSCIPNCTRKNSGICNEAPRSHGACFPIDSELKDRNTSDQIRNRNVSQTGWSCRGSWNCFAGAGGQRITLERFEYIKHVPKESRSENKIDTSRHHFAIQTFTFLLARQQHKQIFIILRMSAYAWRISLSMLNFADQ